MMQEALNASRLTTRKEAVEAGLKAMIQLKKQEKIREYRGKLNWEGDLDDMRTNK